MKKLFLLIALFSVAAFMYAGETNETADTKEKKEVKDDSKPVNRTLVHPENYSHWSLAIGGGANLMIGDYNSNYPNFGEYMKNNINWTVDFDLEYMINPVWGVQLEYIYAPQRAISHNFVDDFRHLGIHTDRDIQTHEVNAQLTFNLTNLARRTRTHTEWNFTLGFGAGAAIYERCKDGVYSWNAALELPVSVSVEYTPIKELGISLDAQYRYYAKDGVNDMVGGQVNDMGLAIGLGLRYHIYQQKPHVRNVDVNTYEPLAVGSTYDENINEVNQRIEQLVGQVDDIMDELDKLKNDQAQLLAAANALSDSLAGYRNIEMTPDVIDTINIGGNMMNVTTNALYNFNSEDNGIYFDFDKDIVKSEYQPIIKKIARRMLNDYKLKVKIIGYCDQEGSFEYNKDLAQRRIDAIIYILVNRYRIDKGRFITDNVGKIDGTREASELKRRVDFEYLY